MGLPKSNIRWNEIWRWLKRRSGSSPSRPVGRDDGARRWVAIGLSVLIAFILWFTFNMREVYTVVLEMPTSITNLPEGEALEGLPPATARVHVQGQGWQLLQLYYNPQRLMVDASDGEEVDLLEAATLMPLPGGVMVQSVSPRTIDLRTARRLSRAVPVENRARLDPPATYDLVGDLRIDPDSVTISGAESLVANIDAWPTAPVRISGMRNEFSVQVPLSDTLARLIRRDIDAVTISGRVDVYTEGTRLIDVVLRGIEDDVEIVALYPDQVRVTYRLPLGQFERALTSEDFFASVRYEDILEDTTGTVMPEIHLPEDLAIRDLRYEPARLNYYMLVD